MPSVCFTEIPVVLTGLCVEAIISPTLQVRRGKPREVELPKAACVWQVISVSQDKEYFSAVFFQSQIYVKKIVMNMKSTF